MMTREEAINRIEDHMAVHRIGEYPHIKLKEALDMSITALRPVSREQLDVVINGLKLRLENNEENGVVYIPKFTVEQMIERLEALKDGSIGLMLITAR